MGRFTKLKVFKCGDKKSLKEGETPNTGAPAPVSPWVNMDNPSDKGQNVTPVTQGVKVGTHAARDMAATEPPVRTEALVPTDVSVWASTPVSVKQVASSTVPTSQNTTPVSMPQYQNSNITNTPMSNCTTSQKHQCTIDHLKLAEGDPAMPGTKYSFYLPSGAQLEIPSLPDAISKHGIPDAMSKHASDRQNSSATLGEKAILECEENGQKIQVVLNSVMSYTSKCLDERIKTKDIEKILINNYNQSELTDSSKLARSLLNKEIRPKRNKANYLNVVPMKLSEVCKMLICCVKTIKKDPRFILASYGLNVPLQYASNNNEAVAAKLNNVANISVNVGTVNISANHNMHSTPENKSQQHVYDNQEVLNDQNPLKICTNSVANNSIVETSELVESFFKDLNQEIINISDHKTSVNVNDPHNNEHNLNDSVNLITSDNSISEISQVDNSDSNIGNITINETIFDHLDCSLTCESLETATRIATQLQHAKPSDDNVLPCNHCVCAQPLMSPCNTIASQSEAATRATRVADAALKQHAEDVHTKSPTLAANVILDTLLAMHTDIKVIANFVPHLNLISEHTKQILDMHCSKGEKPNNKSSFDWTEIQKIWLTPENGHQGSDLELAPILTNLPDHSTPNNIDQVKVDLGNIFADITAEENTDENISFTGTNGHYQNVNNVDLSQCEVNPFVWFVNEEATEGPNATPYLYLL